MKKSSPVLKCMLILPAIFSLSPQVSARPFDWYYSRFATPFAVFYNPALLGSNPGATVGFDTRYTDSADYDARLAFTFPLSRVMKREEHQREGARRNRKYGYANPSYMSSETSISFGGIYAAGEEYNLGIGFATPVRMVQTGISLGLAYRNDTTYVNRNIAVGMVNLGFSANVMRSGIVYFAANKANNIFQSGQNYVNDISFSIGTSGSPFSDTSRIFLPYDILFTYMPKGDKITVGRLTGMLRLNLDLTYIYTSRDIIGQMAVASVGYGFLRDERRRISHNVFASVGMEFVNKSSSSALAGGYGVRNERSETLGAFMYSLVNKTGVATDDYLVSRLQCAAVDSGRVVFGMNTGGAAVNSWVLKIETHGGTNIKTFSGGNVIPASILWDGLSSEGDKLEDDIVYAKLVVRGKEKVVESGIISVEIIGGRPRPKKDL